MEYKKCSAINHKLEKEKLSSFDYLYYKNRNQRIRNIFKGLLVLPTLENLYKVNLFHTTLHMKSRKMFHHAGCIFQEVAPLYAVFEPCLSNLLRVLEFGMLFFSNLQFKHL